MSVKTISLIDAKNVSPEFIGCIVSVKDEEGEKFYVKDENFDTLLGTRATIFEYIDVCLNEFEKYVIEKRKMTDEEINKDLFPKMMVYDVYEINNEIVYAPSQLFIPYKASEMNADNDVECHLRVI